MPVIHNSLTDLFEDTADAIREHTKSVNLIVADDFPNQIRNIKYVTDDEKLERYNKGCLDLGSWGSYFKHSSSMIYGWGASNNSIRPINSSGAGSSQWMDWGQPFKINIHFFIDAYMGAFDQNQSLTGAINYYGAPCIEISKSTGNIGFGWSENGTSWTNWTYPDSFPIPVFYHFYNVSYEYTGEKVVYTLRDTKKEYKYEFTPTSVFYNDGSHDLVFGHSGPNQIILTNGYVDLDNTYIEQNGVLMWGFKTD